MGRITKLKYNDNTSSIFKYDLAGSTYNTADAPNASIGALSEVQDPGVTTRFQRDALGRIVRKTQILNDGETRTISYGYVPAGQGGAGSVQSITYPSGKTLNYAYDTTGQIVGMQWNGTQLVSRLEWNPLGQPTYWEWPGVKTSPTSLEALAEFREYNTAGLLTNSNLMDLTWDAAGRITNVLQNHMVRTHLTNQAQSVMFATSFQYNPKGQLTASTHTLIDKSGLVRDVEGTIGEWVYFKSMGYSYDANGNRLASVLNTRSDNSIYGITSSTYDYEPNTNRLVQDNSTQAGTNYTWQFTVDASGSRTYHSPSGYLIYGADGRIAKYKPWLTIENNAVNYVYNSASQRVLKSGYWHYESGDFKFQKEHTLYADADEYSVMGTYSNVRSSQSAATENATDSTEVIYLPTASGLMPVATEINGRLYAINTDHLNTPRRLTDSEGRVAWQWILAGYGEAMPTTGWYGYNQIHRNYWGPPSISFTPPVVFNLRYPGQQWDPESGLVYNINRYYDVSSGRYIQADPIGLGGGWNRFTYVEGNPLSWADPDGLSPRGLPRKPIELMPLEGGGGGMAGGGDFLVGILDPANLSRYTDQTLPTTLKAHRLIREKLQSLKIVNLFMADLYPMIRIHQEIGGGRQMMGNTTDLVIPTMVQLIFQEVFHQIAI